MTLLHTVTPDEETTCDSSLLRALSGQLEREINTQLDTGRIIHL